MREALFRLRRPASAVALLLAAALVPTTVYAHPGHATASGLLSGLAHPWTGLDHVTAMLAIGLWATLMHNQSKVAMLIATAVGIVAGTVLGAYTDLLTMGELLTILSVIVIGIFVTVAGQARTPLAAILVALFCLFHGYVHTFEVSPQLSPLAFSGGFLMSMLALQWLGMMIGRSLSKRELLARGAGACCSALGLVMLIAR